MQNLLILGFSVLQINWCGWESVFLQNFCRTRGFLDQILVVLSPSSLGWALNSTCVWFSAWRALCKLFTLGCCFPVLVTLLYSSEVF